MQMTHIVRTEYNAAGLAPFEVDCQKISIGRIRNIIVKKNHLFYLVEQKYLHVQYLMQQ